MTDYLTIVKSVYRGLSQRQAAATHHVSRNTISLLVQHARDLGCLTSEDLNTMDNAYFCQTERASEPPFSSDCPVYMKNKARRPGSSCPNATSRRNRRWRQ